MFSGQPVNSQPQPLGEEPIQPEIPTHSKFSFIKAIKLWQIVFLLILLIPATAFFLSKNQSNQQIACTMEAKLCPDGTSVSRTGPKCEFSPCPTPTPNLYTEGTRSATANWKTYNGNGYFFRYPDDWNSTETTESRYIQAENKTIQIKHVTIKSADITLYFDTEENNNFVKNEDYLSFIKERQRDVAFKTSKVDGTNAVYGSYFAGGAYPSVAIWHTSLNFYNNGKTYSFLVDYQKGEPQESLLLKILSTFKFTDPTTANWKTYTHPDNIFSLKYPQNWTGRTEQIPEGIKLDYRDFIAQSPDYQLSAGYPVLEKGAEFFVRVENTNEKSIEDVFNKDPLAPQIAMNKTKTTVDGLEAIQYDYTYEANIATMTEFLKNDKHYTIKYRYVDASSKQSEWSIYLNLLKSFKVTAQ